MAEQVEKTLITTVLFLDIVGYSRQPVPQQLAWKADFNRLLGQLLTNAGEQDRIVLDTGDGAAVCFLDTPEDALEVAIRLREWVEADDGPGFQLYLGINLGPVKVVRDLNQHRNLIGDGINVAQRVMSFAQPNQIMVSRSFHDIAAYLTPLGKEIFHYRGIHTDKHGRGHEIYEVLPPGHVAAGSAPGETDSGETTLSMANLRTLEGILSDYVGPIAATLVRRGAPSAPDIEQLRQRLASLIEDGTQQQEFLQRSKLLSSKPGAQSKATESSPSAPAQDGSGIDETTRQTIEQALAKIIGPIARVLVKREINRGADRHTLCQRLAARITDIDERQRFLERFGDQ